MPNVTNDHTPWTLARFIARYSDGHTPAFSGKRIAAWRQELDDLVGEEEAERLIARTSGK